ncbi:MAG: hypothetical protein JRN21_06325 [Nitrososphaerota archaeon]|nr:hypothetical protein [Nitrososphaerota archaeon]
MSEWRAETAGDLGEAKAALESVARSLSGEATAAQVRSVWAAYARIEKSIAFIRLEIEEENPGRFIPLGRYAVPDERQAMQFALKSLSKGADSFTLGDFRLALRDLRDARNYLRAFLRRERLKRVRKGRVRG